VLLAAVTLLVVAGVANVGGLLIARGLVRRREVAVRAALGASRGRVVSLFLSETVPLSLAGGVAGLLAAEGFSGLVDRLYPSAVPLELGTDLRVAGYALALAVALGLAVGLLPGLHAARPSVVNGLGGATTPGRRRRIGLLGSLVVVQIALSFVLVAGVGLLVRSVTTVSRAGGFDPERIATLRLRPRLVGYGPEQARPVTREIVDRLSGLPGVRSVTLGAGLPPPFWYDGPYTVGRPGESAGTGEGPTAAWIDAVGPRFFETFSLDLLRGRDFDARDAPGTPPVAIVNRTLAARLWPDGEVIGRRLVLDGESYRVIGVVEDPPAYGFDDRALLAYLAYWQDPGRVDARIAVATNGPAGPLLPTIRQAVHGIDPVVPVVETRTMRSKLRRGFAQVHLAGRVLGVAGGLTLLLSLVGLVGVVGLSVTQRTREIAVRRALGSTRPQAVGLILRETSILVVVALTGGLGAALVLGRTLEPFLHGVSPRDPVTLAIALAAVAISGTLASWRAASRAARIDPMTTLRES
ncbi:MAG: FtsX-like permease family protein, partial [Thermoanaerobaculia bacterium]